MRHVISSGLVEVKFDKLVENREKAILILIDDKQYWLPKSVIDFREWSNFVEIPEWLAKEKGLI